MPDQQGHSPNTEKEIQIPGSHKTGQMAILPPTSAGISFHSFCSLPSLTSVISDLITIIQVVMAESAIQPAFVEVPGQVQGSQFLGKAP